MATWTDVLHEEKSKPYFQNILATIKQERAAGKIIYPDEAHVFSAFKITAFSDIKVVILGQDPYHGANQAHGLAFSVLPAVEIPPSLKNIYKALQIDDPEFKAPAHGYLGSWAQQGVFLLNSILTVEQGKAHSHAPLGWAQFTDKVIAQINAHLSQVVFLLWGNEAQKKGANIDTKRHLVLKTSHPSPLAAHRGFLECHHFSRANAYLKESGKSPIDWQLPQHVDLKNLE